MARYDAKRMELSTRNRVALASCAEVKEGRGTPSGGVWPNGSHLPREQMMRGRRVRRCADHVDLRRWRFGIRASAGTRRQANL